MRQPLLHLGLPAFLLALLSALPAQAHVMDGPLGGFGSGFGHPLAGFDHLLAMLAVGLWGAQMGGRSVWTLPATFPMIMCVGGIIGLTGLLPDQPIEYGIAVSVIVLGGAIAAAWRAPEWAALVLIAAFALMHGYPHGVLAPRASDPAAFTVGFVVSTGVIHVIGIAIGAALKPIGGGRLVQALGAAIALAGFWFLFGLVTG
ncbi:HupE/UreJ family protein [Rhizobium rosettiformans]|uniref:HupE/UreJ family protein n=1 Tax=Rhizobium rosettiformans TaxID=1368430 RepID=UPI002862BFC9|nr:HupE/UreJ family protein [Rhizobium rosettiformans]MDR7028647.1 urease accessory protein [Rhizobium rosettiformans]MDR7064071.1 urease accessory protein [Rhizobium rosettiformans]